MKARYVFNKRNSNKPHVCAWTIPDASRPKGLREVRESYATKPEAYIAVAKKQRDIDSGMYAPSPLTFGEAAERWLKFREYKPQTRIQYQRIIDHVLTDYVNLPMAEVALMRKELSDLLWTLQPARAQQTNKLLVGACRRAMAEGDIDRNRLEEIDLPSIVVHDVDLIPHTAEQLRIILANMPDAYRLTVLLARGCGLRIGEIAGLETNAISDGYLEVKTANSEGFEGLPKKRKEGFRPRKVPIPVWLVPEITAHIDAYARDGVLFPRMLNIPRRRYTDVPASKYASPSTFADRPFKVAVKAAGLPNGNPEQRFNFSFHQLRKNYATQLRNESAGLGLTAGDVEQWLGHKDMTRDVYAFQDSDTLAKGCKLRDPRVSDAGV